jgi:hypothetical protein
MMVVVHILCQLLNDTLATNFVVGTVMGFSQEEMCTLL